MRKIIGAVFVSLDGVMQAPGAPDEDRSGGFELGGWLPPFWDEESAEGLDKLFAKPFDLLLGRRTYDIFAAYWPFVTGQAKEMGRKFDQAHKYVMTRSRRSLDWQDSSRLDSISAIAELKQGEGRDLIIQGSATLYPQLLNAGLIDQLILRTFPLLLGSGKRWFGDGTAPSTLRMVDHQITRRGNIIASYEPVGAVEIGSFSTDEPTPAELERRESVDKGTW